MSRSLQDQLLAVGLVTEEQIEEARRKEAPTRKGRGQGGQGGQGGKGGKAGKDPGKGPGRGPGKAGGRRGRGQPAHGKTRRRRETPEGASAESAPAPAEKRRGAPLDKKRLRQRVRALLEKRSQNVENGEIPYNFVRGKRVKRLYVDEALRARLVSGELAIAEVYGLHHILDEPALAELRELLPETFVHRHGDEAAPAAEDAQDDYDGFDVPDDIVW